MAIGVSEVLAIVGAWRWGTGSTSVSSTGRSPTSASLSPRCTPEARQRLSCGPVTPSEPSSHGPAYFSSFQERAKWQRPSTGPTTRPFLATGLLGSLLGQTGKMAKEGAKWLTGVATIQKMTDFKKLKLDPCSSSVRSCLFESRQSCRPSGVHNAPVFFPLCSGGFPPPPRSSMGGFFLLLLFGRPSNSFLNTPGVCPFLFVFGVFFCYYPNSIFFVWYMCLPMYHCCNCLSLCVRRWMKFFDTR